MRVATQSVCVYIHIMSCSLGIYLNGSICTHCLNWAVRNDTMIVECASEYVGWVGWRQHLANQPNHSPVPAQWFAQQDEAVSISQVYLLWTDSSMRIVQLSTILPFFWQQYHIFGYNFPPLCNHLVLVYLSQDVVVQVWAQSRLWLSSSQLLLPYGSFSSFGTCKLCLFSIVTCSRLTPARISIQPNPIPSIHL